MVLAELAKLNPRDLNEQTEVVQRQLLQYTSELDILQKREALLTETLDTVTKAYDELVALSKDAKDVETLRKSSTVNSIISSGCPSNVLKSLSNRCYRPHQGGSHRSYRVCVLRRIRRKS